MDWNSEKLGILFYHMSNSAEIRMNKYIEKLSVNKGLTYHSEKDDAEGKFRLYANLSTNKCLENRELFLLFLKEIPKSSSCTFGASAEVMESIIKEAKYIYSQ